MAPLRNAREDPPMYGWENKQESFVPGKVTKVSFELPDIAHIIPKGHRIYRTAAHPSGI